MPGARHAPRVPWNLTSLWRPERIARLLAGFVPCGQIAGHLNCPLIIEQWENESNRRWTKPIQKCPMCVATKNVVSSHLYPAALYGNESGFSPLLIGNGIVMHTDRQIQHPLLCLDCEDILNKGGETWTNPKLFDRKIGFPLYEMVIKLPAEYERAGGLYFAAQNPEIDVERLTHFALGIYWKAAVHSWKGGETDPLIELGPYAEALRLWLRGEESFPKNVSLGVVLSRPDKALAGLHGPVEAESGRWRTFLLNVPGAMFMLSVGRLIPIEMRYSCFHENQQHPIFVSDEVTDAVWNRLSGQYGESRKTQKYLEAKAERALKVGT